MWPFRCTDNRDPGALAADDERRAPRPRRRRRRHLAPGDDHRCGRVLPAEAAVGALDEMLARLLLERLARRREDGAVREPRLDRLVRARERDVGAAQIGSLAGDGRHRAASLDRAARRRRPDRAAGPPPRRRACRRSCARSTPPRRSRGRRSSRARSATCCSTLHGGSQPERPWPRQSTPMTRYFWSRSSASRRNRRPWPETPCRQTTGCPAGSPHSVTLSCMRAPVCRNAAQLAIASTAVAASASGTTESITGRHEPESSAPRSPAKSAGLPIVVPSSDHWPK